MAAGPAAKVALTIAGSDSSAGAGVQADLKTFAALGVYGLNAITCVVAETPGQVTRIFPIPVDMLREQIRVLFDAFPVAAVKTGLLHSAALVHEVAEILATERRKQTRRLPIVVDPVMVATSGALLLQKEAIDTCERELFPLATLLTPNLDEAGALLGHRIRDVAQMHDAAQRLRQKYGASVLLKGGHLPGEDATDLLVTAHGICEFTQPFVRDVSTHGTGCTYSAAITAGLALGLELEPAIRQAKEFVTRSINQHFTWQTGAGTRIDALNHSPERP